MKVVATSDARSIFFAFYGWDTPIKPLDFVRFFQRIEAAVGVKLEVTEVSYLNERKLRRPRFQTLVRSLELDEGAQISGITAYTSHKFFRENGYSALMVSYSSKSEFDEFDSASSVPQLLISIQIDLWIKISKDISFVLNNTPDDFIPRYGFIKIADAASMIGPYAVGMSCDYGDDCLNSMQMVALQQVEPDALNNCIIDIFPVNYIGCKHLRREIEGTTFEKWAEGVQGTALSKVKPDLWVWRVDPAFDLWESIAPRELRNILRKQLHEAGILIQNGLPWLEVLRICRGADELNSYSVDTASSAAEAFKG